MKKALSCSRYFLTAGLLILATGCHTAKRPVREAVDAKKDVVRVPRDGEQKGVLNFGDIVWSKPIENEARLYDPWVWAFERNEDEYAELSPPPDGWNPVRRIDPCAGWTWGPPAGFGVGNSKRK